MTHIRSRDDISITRIYNLFFIVITIKNLKKVFLLTLNQKIKNTSHSHNFDDKTSSANCIRNKSLAPSVNFHTRTCRYNASNGCPTVTAIPPLNCKHPSTTLLAISVQKILVAFSLELIIIIIISSSVSFYKHHSSFCLFWLLLSGWNYLLL